MWIGLAAAEEPAPRALDRDARPTHQWLMVVPEPEPEPTLMRRA